MCAALDVWSNLAIKLALILLKMAPASWNCFSFQIFCFFELSLFASFNRPLSFRLNLFRFIFLLRIFENYRLWAHFELTSFFTRLSLCSSFFFLFWFNIFMKFRQFSILHKLFCAETDNLCPVFIIVAVLIWRIYNSLIIYLKQIITAPLSVCRSGSYCLNCTY